MALGFGGSARHSLVTRHGLLPRYVSFLFFFFLHFSSSFSPSPHAYTHHENRRGRRDDSMTLGSRESSFSAFCFPGTSTCRFALCQGEGGLGSGIARAPRGFPHAVFQEPPPLAVLHRPCLGSRRPPVPHWSGTRSLGLLHGRVLAQSVFAAHATAVFLDSIDSGDGVGEGMEQQSTGCPLPDARRRASCTALLR